jgi:hypothetical protein
MKCSTLAGILASEIGCLLTGFDTGYGWEVGIYSLHEGAISPLVFPADLLDYFASDIGFHSTPQQATSP